MDSASSSSAAKTDGLVRGVIYTQSGCNLCCKVRESLKGKGYEVEEREVEDLLSGKYRDMDALAQLSMQNMELPVVVLNDRCVGVGDVLGNKLGGM